MLQLKLLPKVLFKLINYLKELYLIVIELLELLSEIMIGPNNLFASLIRFRKVCRILLIVRNDYLTYYFYINLFKLLIHSLSTL